MSKIMVVEDDAALREIYSIRITAEGYEVVGAGDGEEALAVAVREKPDLILSDVMMPKISGFDMLDILRNTPETANIHVIMMTALSADDQRNRGERLGCDKYLVKSQVGIEDVVNAIHEVLGDKPVDTTAPAGPAVPGVPALPTPPTPPASASTPAVPGVPAPNSAVPEAPIVSSTPQPFIVNPKPQADNAPASAQSEPQLENSTTPAQPEPQGENGTNPAQ